MDDDRKLRVDEFWDVVRRALRSNGRVFFVDEIEDAWRHDEYLLPEEFTVDASVPIVRRTLRDGTSFRVVKVFWDTDDLRHALRDLGWKSAIHPVGAFYWGEAA